MIFLDLRRSKYIGVGGTRLHQLSAAILGETLADQPPASPADDEVIHALVRQLSHHQLLSDAPSRDTSQRPTLLDPVASLDMDDEPATGSEWHQLPRLWQATLITSAWLRRYSLADIADRVVALRTQWSNHVGDVDPDTLNAAVREYMRLRPFALTSHDRCLNDSLALIHFLASRGMFPQWVIGVRVQPFCAHSWVQSEGTVLNDLPEHVRSYRPLLIV